MIIGHEHRGAVEAKRNLQLAVICMAYLGPAAGVELLARYFARTDADIWLHVDAATDAADSRHWWSVPPTCVWSRRDCAAGGAGSTVLAPFSPPPRRRKERRPMIDFSTLRRTASRCGGWMNC